MSNYYSNYADYGFTSEQEYASALDDYKKHREEEAAMEACFEEKYYVESHAIGYRNNECYGSGVSDIYEIIEHEINELENEDIPDYMAKHFNFKPDDNVDLATSVIQFLKDNYPNHKFGLWLASKDAVIEIYNGTNENIEMYVVPDSAIIISDLGYDGFLVVSEKPLDTGSLD